MTVSTLSSKQATERLQKLATQFNEEYLGHERKARFDVLLQDYQATQTYVIPEFKVHELFDQFVANPDIDTFVPKTTTLISKLKDWLAKSVK